MFSDWLQHLKGYRNHYKEIQVKEEFQVKVEGEMRSLVGGEMKQEPLKPLYTEGQSGPKYELLTNLSQEDQDIDALKASLSCTASEEGILCLCQACIKNVDKPKSGCGNILASDKNLLKPFACSICNLRFEFKCRLVRHFKLHKGFKPFPCNICNVAFTEKHSLRQHNLHQHTNSNKTRKVCCFCDNSFGDIKALNKHIIRVHLKQKRFEPAKCTECSKTYAEKKGLLRHMKKVHFRAEEFICFHCNKVYFDKAELATHIQSSHLPGSASHVCDLCGFVANRKSSLRNHKASKHSEKRFSCEICGKRFAFKDKLEIHMPTHSNEAPWSCEVCGKCFKREGNLIQHQYVHSDLRPHKCHECGQTFRMKTHVKQHMAVHGLVKKHKCIICSQLFTYKRELTKHLSDH